MEELVSIFHYGDNGSLNTIFYKNLGLSDEAKLYLVLDNLDATEITIPKDKINVNYPVEQIIADYNNKMKTAADVENKYYSLFNEKLINHADTNGCPFYKYDSVNKVYYEIGGCGGTTADIDYYYINNYAYHNDEIYAYISIGYGGYDIETNKHILYTDLELKNKYQGNYTDDFEINESNYKDFSEYKYTFGKYSDGNYYFKSIEKTK